jgi:hypothetical protein
MWYFILNNKSSGPLEDSQLIKFAREGVITQKTKVWKKGMPEWVSAEDTDLFKHFDFVPLKKLKENSNCTNCGVQISPGIRFCSNCGSKVKSEGFSQINNNINLTNVVVTTNKSVWVAILLTFFFGPLGMLYSTVTGGILMFFVTILLAIVTFGFGLFITQPICIVWAAIAASNHNKMFINGSKQI